MKIRSPFIVQPEKVEAYKAIRINFLVEFILKGIFFYLLTRVFGLKWTSRLHKGGKTQTPQKLKMKLNQKLSTKQNK